MAEFASLTFGLKINCVYTVVLEDSYVESYAIDFN